MAGHQFGIMERRPAPGERYDTYEPEKIRLIRVDDRWIEPLMPALGAVPCFCHTLDIPCPGLVYAGITLIPPTSMERMLEILGDTPAFEELRALLLRAKREGKFVIHYGL